MLDQLFKKTGNQKAANKSKGNPLEQHAEKIVLAVSAIVSVAVLWMFVISSPNAVVIDGRKLKPSQVDDYVRRQAETLKAEIEGPAAPPPLVSGKELATFTKMLNNPIDDVPDFEIAAPRKSDTVIEEDRLYALPAIGGVDKVVAEVVRGAAHVPLDEVGMGNPYSTAMTKLGDIDLVTVEGSFDIASLYRNFKQSFLVKTMWRDEKLASPVFASAQLQRRRLVDGGRWSDWEVVPRTKIDQYRSMIAGVPETVDELRWDVGMEMDKFRGFDCQRDIIQPDPYDFASANAVWLSPSFHKEYLALEERDKKDALRQERERLLNQRGRGGQGGYDPSRTTPRGGAGGEDMYDYGNPAAGGRATRTPVRPGGGAVDSRMRGRVPARGRGDMSESTAGYYDNEMMYPGELPRGRQQRTVDDVVADNVKVFVDEQTKFDEMRDMLVFWAHDDTAEPGSTYQYRIRLGVFNPIAGKNWFSKQDEAYKNHVILWSDFSEATEAVKIDPMVHFFPVEMARTREKGVLIQVSKYHLGNWRSESFDVRPGELIGKEVDFKPTAKSGPGMPGLPGSEYREYEEMYGGMNASMPKTIDYSTGATLVDIVKTDKWTGIRSLARTQVEDVLYTADGVTIVHLPVKRNNWSNAMKDQYKKIEDASLEEVALSQSRGQSALKSAMQRVGQDRTGGRGYIMDRGGYEMMDSRSDRGMYGRN